MVYFNTHCFCVWFKSVLSVSSSYSSFSLLTAPLVYVTSRSMKAFLSAREFAIFIKKDPKTVVTWIEKGLIPGSKRVGHRYQIPAKEIETYRNSSQYPPSKWQK